MVMRAWTRINVQLARNDTKWVQGSSGRFALGFLEILNETTPILTISPQPYHAPAHLHHRRNLNSSFMADTMYRRIEMNADFW